MSGGRMLYAKAGTDEAWTREALLAFRETVEPLAPPTRGSAPGIPIRPEWMHRAACRGADINLFYPVTGQNARPAKRICATCPVQDECRAYVDKMEPHQADHGVWGRTSPRDRQNIRRHGTSTIVYHDNCQVCGEELVGRQRAVCSAPCDRLRKAEQERRRRRGEL